MIIITLVKPLFSDDMTELIKLGLQVLL